MGELISRAEAKRLGLSVPRNVKPADHIEKYISGIGVREWDVFRVEDCVPRRTVKEIPPVKIDLLKAIFTINKSAKRYRDSAQKNYQ